MRADTFLPKIPDGPGRNNILNAGPPAGTQAKAREPPEAEGGPKVGSREAVGAGAHLLRFAFAQPAGPRPFAT